MLKKVDYMIFGSSIVIGCIVSLMITVSTPEFANQDSVDPMSKLLKKIDASHDLLSTWMMHDIHHYAI